MHAKTDREAMIAAAVAGVSDVIITAKPDQELVTLPEGASYLGFIFARGESSDGVVRALREAGLPFELVKVDLRAKKTEKGDDFLAINPRGYVPALQLDNGEVLAEGVAIVQYIADQKPESNLAPKAGTMERYRLQEWLTFISSELHKGFSPLFNPAMPEDGKKAIIVRVQRNLGWLDKQLATKPYLLGDGYSVADAYAFTVLGWTRHVNVDLSPYTHIVAYLDRVGARPAVQAALAVQQENANNRQKSQEHTQGGMRIAEERHGKGGVSDIHQTHELRGHRVGRAVRLVADGAVLRYWLMVVHEGAALFQVALVAGFIHRVRDEQLVVRRAVRIVAARALDRKSTRLNSSHT